MDDWRVKWSCDMVVSLNEVNWYTCMWNCE